MANGTMREVTVENGIVQGKKSRSRLRRFWPVFLVGSAIMIYLLQAFLWPAHSSSPSSPSDGGPTSAGGDEAVADAATMARLVHSDPIACLAASLRRYHRNVQGYRATFLMRETDDGKLGDRDVVDAWYHEKPVSVFMHWIAGPSTSQGVVYVQGQYNGKVQVRTKYVSWLLLLDLNSPQTKSLKNFGLKRATERVLNEVESAKGQGPVHAEYLGEETLAEVAHKPCHHLRVHFAVPREKRVTDIDAYLDTENWLQIATVLRDGSGDLVGDYFFRDLQINPEIPADQFDKTALKKW